MHKIPKLIFCYTSVAVENSLVAPGNQAGLIAFGYTWEEFTVLPSRKSCEEGQLEERLEYLDSVLDGEDSASSREYTGVSRRVGE